jgi:hypothetical protein
MPFYRFRTNNLLMKSFVLLFLLTVPTIHLMSQNELVHVIVALCDNESQGIVPVPEKIGDGDNPGANLYWGCGYGVKNFFDRKTADWTLLECQNEVSDTILQRCIFKHKATGTRLVADAYRGRNIKKATIDFFDNCAARFHSMVTIEEQQVDLGAADLICYVGHDGLMEFDLDSYPTGLKGNKKKAIMLACTSSEFFDHGIMKSEAHPLLWTRGLMAPEAYSLEAAVTAWTNGKSDSACEKAAETAYSKYQGISEKASNWLFKTGW